MSTIERFMAVDPEDGVALDICRVPAGLRFTAHGYEVVSVWIDPKHAPTIALSVLEAAGWPEEATQSVTHQILNDLRRVVAIAEQVDKEARLIQRRDALAREFDDEEFETTCAPVRKAINRIIELEDGASRD